MARIVGHDYRISMASILDKAGKYFELSKKYPVRVSWNGYKFSHGKLVPQSNITEYTIAVYDYQAATRQERQHLLDYIIEDMVNAVKADFYRIT